MSDPLFLTAGALASFIIEAAKFAIRRWIMNDSDYDFPPIFYNVALPLVVFLCEILLGAAELGPMPEFTVKFLARWFLGVIIALGTYFLTLKPMKEYAKSLEA
jgi:hypothetical protein